jgi:hypothetical protein
MVPPGLQLQPQKTLDCIFQDNPKSSPITKQVPLPARYVYDFTKLYWYYPESASAALATLRLNLTALGFYGWRQDVLVLVNTTLSNVYADPDLGLTSFTIGVTQEYGRPVSTLSSKSLIVYYLNTAQNSWAKAQLQSFQYAGGGYYNVTVSAFIPIPYQQYLHIWVNDSRGILVEMCGLPYYEMVIRDNAPSGRNVGSDETFVFELGNEQGRTGKISWLGRDLVRKAATNYRPFPFPPIPAKQFAVNVTAAGPSSAFAERPIQIESWNPSFTTPLSVFNASRPETRGARLNQSNKLVFEVNYPPYPPNSNEQRVRIWWHDDADWLPTAQSVYFRVSGSDIALSNGLVNVTTYLAGNAMQYRGYDLRIDYRGVDGKWRSSHVGIQGWDYAASYSWRPGNVSAISARWVYSDARGGLLAGPVRALVYAATSDRIDRAHKSINNGPLQISAIIYVASGVRYVAALVNGTWLADTTTNFYVAQFIYSNSSLSDIYYYTIPNVQTTSTGTFPTGTSWWQYKTWDSPKTDNLWWDEWNS